MKTQKAYDKAECWKCQYQMNSQTYPISHDLYPATNIKQDSIKKRWKQPMWQNNINKSATHSITQKLITASMWYRHNNSVWFMWAKLCAADVGARAVEGVGLRSLAWWDGGFESRREHWWLSVVRQMSQWRAYYLYRGVLPTAVRRCVWSRNLVNEEATPRVGMHGHRGRYKKVWGCVINLRWHHLRCVIR
jgi:hypothetical protein